MGIFGKNKEVQNENEPSFAKATEGRGKHAGGTEEDGEGRTVKVKKIKDLSPGNKKRRKEPIRAWNKFDRIFIFLILVMTAGSSFFLALSSRGYKLPNLPRLKIPKYNIFGEKVVVLESNGKNKKKAESMIGNFNALTKDLTGIYGMYVTDLNNNFSFGIYENENFQAASLIKLPVMVGMYMAEEDGGLSLGSRYKLKAEDKVKGSGSLYSRPVGYELTYHDLIKLMGKESDNTAFNICWKYLGDEKIREIIDRIGMKDTSLEKNETTPADIGLFFHKLWDGGLINRNNKEELLGFMTDTIYEKWLAAGVPGGVRVAHKYGREVRVVNDAGIVYTDNPSGSETGTGWGPYVVVIMSKDIVDKEADTAFPELSGIIYRGITEDNVVR